MISLAASLGIPYQVDVNISPKDDGDLSPLDYSVSRQALSKLFSRPELERYLTPIERREGQANCGLGRITVAIDPEGNVFPCPQWRHSSIGNVRATQFPELWQTSILRTEAAAVAVEANDRLMGMGAALSAFAFCPVRALQTTGDLYTPDPEMRLRAEAAETIRESRG
jgi:MoaA/NifB/PqqE/SkfB family radical SAM enzyme